MLINQDERSGFDRKTTSAKSGKIRQKRWINQCATQKTDKIMVIESVQAVVYKRVMFSLKK